jgi:hypothetical protein
MAVVCTLAAIGVAFCVATGYRPNWLFVRWADGGNAPFAVSNQLEIAARGYPLKRSSASLLCGSDGVHLMLKTRFDIPAFMRRQLERVERSYSPTRIEVMFDQVPGQQMHFRSFWTSSTVISYGPIDTMVTSTLSKADEVVLVDWFRRGAPHVMSVFLADTHFEYGLTPLVEPEAVSGFVGACRPGP